MTESLQTKSVRRQIISTDHMDVDQAMSIYFQEEIIMEILSRLPVRSLLRFKCVSKFWNTLISDPYFKMKHLNRAKNDQNSQKLLVSDFCPNDGLCYFYCCPLSLEETVEDVEKLVYPSSSRHLFGIQCCCDGLVLIKVGDSIFDEHAIHLLWNPSTRESIVLPDPKFRGDEYHFGMGYDPTSGDYKILKISEYDRKFSEILALKGDSWRKVDKHPHGISNVLSSMHSLAFVHSAFHWIGYSRSYSLVSFSISNEVYGDIPLPEQILCFVGDISIGILVLDRMLCVHSASNRQGKETFKLWVLKDYDVKEWESLFTIEDPSIREVTPKYRFANGEVLFLCCHVQRGGREHAFRTSSGPFELWPQGGLLGGVAFSESLIFPTSLTY